MSCRWCVCQNCHFAVCVRSGLGQTPQVRTTSPEKLMPSDESSLNGSAETRSEAPRDDALLACLLLLARTHGEALTADGAVAGLPLEDGRLTPSLFERAAARAGLSSRVVLRPLVNRSPITLFMATLGLSYVIEGFAQFIMGGNLVLGLVIFIVLMIVNFIVIFLFLFTRMLFI